MSEDKNKDLKDKFLQYYRQLPVQKLAAAHIGRDEDTILRWRKEDTAFADQVESAKADWAIEKAKGVKSNEWLLERLMKDHFAERKELTGPEGKPLLDALHNNNSSQEAGQTNEAH